MSTPGDDYDSLTPEQREQRDKEDRAREEVEQAGTVIFLVVFFSLPGSSHLPHRSF